MSSSLQALTTSPSCQNHGRQLQDLVKMHDLSGRQPIQIVSLVLKWKALEVILDVP